MLASITPLGERGRSNRWGSTVLAHLAGTVAPAVVQGAALGWIGSELRLGTAVRLSTIAGVTAAAVVLDALRLRPLGMRRQVAEAWLDQYRGWVYGVGYGAQLGVGWATIVTTWLVWAALIGMLLAGSWWAGAIVGLAFALGRGLPVLATAKVVDGPALQSLHRKMAAWENPFRTASLVSGGAMALILVTLAAGAP